MVTNNEIKHAIKEVAFEKKFNGVQIQALMKVGGVSDLLINALVCNKCHHRTSVVGSHMCCDACETTLTPAERKFLATATPTYEDDIVGVEI